MAESHTAPHGAAHERVDPQPHHFGQIIYSSFIYIQVQAIGGSEVPHGVISMLASSMLLSFKNHMRCRSVRKKVIGLCHRYIGMYAIVSSGHLGGHSDRCDTRQHDESKVLLRTHTKSNTPSLVVITQLEKNSHCLSDCISQSPRAVSEPILQA